VHPLARAGGHPSTTAVAGSLQRPTREHRAGYPQSLAQDAHDARPSWPCSGWGLPSRPSHLGRWWSLTPPFHPYPLTSQEAVCFLWHCPAGHPGSALPTTLPCGARTFLGAPGKLARRGRPADSPSAPSRVGGGSVQGQWHWAADGRDTSQAKGGRRAAGRPQLAVLPDQAAQQAAVALTVALLRRRRQGERRHPPAAR
jgi:hypothetical protein